MSIARAYKIGTKSFNENLSTQVSHADQSSAIRHVGDLGNIVTPAMGETVIDIVDSVISLDDVTAGILDRAIVVHADADDLGLGGNAGSLASGNAGSRVACGVITSC